jgi:peptide-methionine (S)-S-oxide reductase
MGGKTRMPLENEILKGRETKMSVPNTHAVLGTPLQGPFGVESQMAFFGMGCFWGAERAFWRNHDVLSTAVGYMGGETPNPTYEEVCSGLTGHAEVVVVWFDPSRCSYTDLLKTFWERHDPTQGMRQGNDVGTQYRSAIYGTTEEQVEQAKESREVFGGALSSAGFSAVTTEIQLLKVFYFAETYHQQYLHKNLSGYCGLAGTGVSCTFN